MPDEQIQVMIQRLGAQERASDRLMVRAAAYVVFSFAVLGVSLGVLLDDGVPCLVRRVAGLSMVGLFASVLGVFVWAHWKRQLSTLPNPTLLASMSLDEISGEIQRAFDTNRPIIRANHNRVVWMLGLTVAQALVFLATAFLAIAD